MVGSLDARALYPSLWIRESVALCGRAVLASKQMFSNIDYCTVTIYLAITMTEEEEVESGLKELLPTKPATRG